MTDTSTWSLSTVALAIAGNEKLSLDDILRRLIAIRPTINPKELADFQSDIISMFDEAAS